MMERASRLFKKVTVFVAMNPEKASWCTVEEREEMLRRIAARWRNVAVSSGQGLLAEHAAALKADAILKGLRGPADLEMEHQMASVNHLLCGMETLFMVAHEGYAHTSSSLVRQVLRLGGEIRPFVPEEVLPLIAGKR